jgi:hypothetical protein
MSRNEPLKSLLEGPASVIATIVKVPAIRNDNRIVALYAL